MAMPRFLLTVLLVSCIAGSALAQDINRCTGADGSAVFTDRDCRSIDALPANPPPGRSTERSDLIISEGFKTHCPQRLSQLVARIEDAIHGNNVNQLSSLYWWSGQNNADASRLLERLESLASRPLVEIAPVYPAARPDPGWSGDATESPVGRMADIAVDAWQESQRHNESPLAPIAPAPARQRPIGLRVSQWLPNSSSSVSNVLYLRREHGCFWVRF